MCDENKLIFDVIRNKFIYPLIIDVGAFNGGGCKKFIMHNWDVIGF